MENIKFVVRSPFRLEVKVFSDIEQAIACVDKEHDKQSMDFLGCLSRIHGIDEATVSSCSRKELKWKCTFDNWLNTDGCSCDCGCECVKDYKKNPACVCSGVEGEGCCCDCVPTPDLENDEYWANYGTHLADCECKKSGCLECEEYDGSKNDDGW